MSNDFPPPPPPPGGPVPPQGYGYGAPMGGMPPKQSPLAIVALVTGILGVLPCCWGIGIFSIAAIVTGMLGKKEIAESNGAKTGAGLAQWGFILGIVGLVISVLYWILIVSGALDVNTYSDFS